MEKTQEQKTAEARKVWLDFWENVAKVTGDPQDMRLLIDCCENYRLLAEQQEQNNRPADIDNKEEIERE